MADQDDADGVTGAARPLARAVLDVIDTYAADVWLHVDRIEQLFADFGSKSDRSIRDVLDALVAAGLVETSRVALAGQRPASPIYRSVVA